MEFLLINPTDLGPGKFWPLQSILNYRKDYIIVPYKLWYM